MEARRRYEEWLNFEGLRPEERKELEGLGPEEIEDAFYQDLAFGTAGLRGIQGLGTNRMNRFVVARATAGLAEVIAARGQEAKDRGVAIAWDVRINSDVYMVIAARVLAAYGIQVHVFDGIRPTPMLSYAVRALGAQAGIVVTASHNPQDYNGYKVYWEEGSQIVDEIADEIQAQIQALEYDQVDLMDWDQARDQGLIRTISQDLEEDYYKKTLDLAIYDQGIDKDIKLVFTPLNGTGNLPVRRVLRDRGFSKVSVVKEQEEPDGTFASVGYPNPEDIKAFDLALRDARDLDADLVLATDPDCDRVAIVVREDQGTYTPLTGNQTGALMVDYILSGLKETGRLAQDAAVVKSLVTGDMGTQVAQSYGVPMYETLTGFKNICGLANKWDRTGDHTFVFGYEESIGYTIGDHVRDKDAVSSSMILVEMAAYYKARGLNLVQVLEGLYRDHGYHKEYLTSLVLKGQEGARRIGRIMDDLRRAPLKTMGDLRVQEVLDYKDGLGDIPPQNLLHFKLEGGSSAYLRPSGTEPKLKLYFYSQDEDRDQALAILDKIKAAVKARIDQVD